MDIDGVVVQVTPRKTRAGDIAYDVLFVDAAGEQKKLSVPPWDEEGLVQSAMALVNQPATARYSVNGKYLNLELIGARGTLPPDVVPQLPQLPGMPATAPVVTQAAQAFPADLPTQKQDYRSKEEIMRGHADATAFAFVGQLYAGAGDSEEVLQAAFANAVKLSKRLLTHALSGSYDVPQVPTVAEATDAVATAYAGAGAVQTGEPTW